MIARLLYLIRTWLMRRDLRAADRLHQKYIK